MSWLGKKYQTISCLQIGSSSVMKRWIADACTPALLFPTPTFFTRNQLMGMVFPLTHFLTPFTYVPNRLSESSSAVGLRPWSSRESSKGWCCAMQKSLVPLTGGGSGKAMAYAPHGKLTGYSISYYLGSLTHLHIRPRQLAHAHLLKRYCIVGWVKEPHGESVCILQ